MIAKINLTTLLYIIMHFFCIKSVLNPHITDIPGQFDRNNETAKFQVKSQTISTIPNYLVNYPFKSLRIESTGIYKNSKKFTRLFFQLVNLNRKLSELPTSNFCNIVNDLRYYIFSYIITLSDIELLIRKNMLFLNFEENFYSYKHTKLIGRLKNLLYKFHNLESLGFNKTRLNTHLNGVQEDITIINNYLSCLFEPNPLNFLSPVFSSTYDFLGEVSMILDDLKQE